jgi:nicotinate phosphoribosyltransferase
VVTLRDEAGPRGAEALLTKVMDGGRRSRVEDLDEARARFEQELAWLPPGLASLEGPSYPVTDSPALLALSDQTRRHIGVREEA